METKPSKKTVKLIEQVYKERGERGLLTVVSFLTQHSSKFDVLFVGEYLYTRGNEQILGLIELYNGRLPLFQHHLLALGFIDFAARMTPWIEWDKKEEPGSRKR